MPKAKTLSGIGEFGLIATLRRRAYRGDARLSIGDDTAVLPFNRTHDELFTTDMVTQGVHFSAGTPLRLVGKKVVNCSISDIAAMGGLPRFAVVSLGVPARCRLKDVRELYAGMNAAARKYQVGIVGGDTIKCKTLTINVAMTGRAQRSHVVLRSGAKKGHVILVTGRVGRSLKSGHHLRFTPRVKESQYLVKKFKPSAMIDCSDGLLVDLTHIMEESGVGARIYEDRIPLRKGATLRQALSDGEDFELIFTLAPALAKKLQHAKHPGMRFTPIGEITRSGLTLIAGENSRIAVKTAGYRHF